ncbi:helix-turn-helix domain-containing protein [Pseudomonas spelaei]
MRAKALGGRIRVQRKTCWISRDALVLACNIHRSDIGRIERGEVNITFEKLDRIVSVLECDPCGLRPQMGGYPFKTETFE